MQENSYVERGAHYENKLDERVRRDIEGAKRDVEDVKQLVEKIRRGILSSSDIQGDREMEKLASSYSHLSI